MRYHYEKPVAYTSKYGQTYRCDHPVYSRCTLYFQKGIGLAVIQQRFNRITKSTHWSEIDPWLCDDIYNQPGFQDFFIQHAKAEKKGLFPTVTVRQIMWALKMKPLKKERWETVFDHKTI